MLKIRIRLQHFCWQVHAALACFVLALVAGIAGSLLTTGWILDAEEHPALYKVGVILLMLTVPAMILGGHYLDLIDRTPLHKDE